MFAWLKSQPEIYEIVRYIFGGILTTLVSLICHYGCCFLFAKKEKCTETGIKGRIVYFGHIVNKADAKQMSIAGVITWVVTVLFAFWINKSMVFQAQYNGDVWSELVKFAGGRVVGNLIFNLGLALLLKKFGLNNIINKIVVTVLITLFNYFVSKFIVF